MRKLVFQMMTTLNGRIDDPYAWLSGVSEDQYQDVDQLYETFDTVLIGRVTYEEMFAYWPGAETEAGGTETNKRMARKMNTYKKLVLSRERRVDPLAWNKAELVVARSDADIVKLVADLKAKPGRDIHCLSLAALRLGLVDEFHAFVYPVVSAGKSWLDQFDGKHDLDLVSAKTYENGVVGLHYRASQTTAAEVRPKSFTEKLA